MKLSTLVSLESEWSYWVSYYFHERIPVNCSYITATLVYACHNFKLWVVGTCVGQPIT